MRYLKVFYGVVAAYTLLLLANVIASSINTSPADIAVCIIGGTLLSCTLYIIEAIENLRQDLNLDKDPNRDDR